MLELSLPPKINCVPLIKSKTVAVIPCYNTQSSIAEVVSKTKRYVDEVIVIDDGSIDMTAEVARASGARVITHEKNQGKGAAIKTAVTHIDADIIVLIDGDGQHDPRDISNLLEPIIRGDADFVIGSRFLLESKLSSAPFSRKIANACASIVISFVISMLQPLARVFGRRSELDESRTVLPVRHKLIPMQSHYRVLNSNFKWISDCTCGLTAMKKKNWSKLNLISNGFEIETEMIFEQAKNRFIIAEAPITCNWDGSLSRLSVVKDGLRTLSLLIKKLIAYSNSEKSYQDANRRYV